ncbi:MAG: hypothetical protein L0338_19290 [Acidobacteria bacterium]|nr:hypothetical protein [Acidobacteriota bacterium]
MNAHFAIQVRDIYDPGKNTINLARLFEASESQRAQLATVETPFPTVTPRAPSLPPILADLFSKKRSARKVNNLPKPKECSIALVEGTLTGQGTQLNTTDRGALTLRVPFFLSRHITAAGLKALAGRPSDTLLRQCNQRWEIVGDDELIDLADESQLFKLGPLQVYS